MRRPCLALTTVFDPTILDVQEQVGLILAHRVNPPAEVVAAEHGFSYREAYRRLSVEIQDVAERIGCGRAARIC